MVTAYQPKLLEALVGVRYFKKEVILTQQNDKKQRRGHEKNKNAYDMHNYDVITQWLPSIHQ